jgi:ABC-type transporter Mla subunit MlaD
MVTQAPKRSAVLIAIAFALSCVGLMIFVWTQFKGPIPFAPEGYRVHATFKETGLLVPGADVRISGVNVGRVTDVKANGIYSNVTMDIRSQYSPIPNDTRAILRQKTLLGEAYVMLSTGSKASGALKDGGSIPNSHVADTVSIDQALNAFDPETQKNFQNLLDGLFLGLQNRGQDINNALGSLDPAVTELTAVVGVLNQQQGNVQRLVNNTATVLTTLGDRSTSLQDLVRSGNDVLAATAARNSQLTATVNALPPFLAQLRTTLPILDATLAIAKPSLDALGPVAPKLPRALAALILLSGPAINLLHQAPGLLNDASIALPSITRFSGAFGPAVDVILPAAQEIIPVVNYMGLYSKELTAALTHFGQINENIAPAATTQPVGTAPAGMAHFPRVLPPLNNEDFFGQAIREPTNRHNAYISPGELNNLATGLQSSDCSNTGDAATVPVPAVAIKCVTQPAYPWGSQIPGLASGYFPHLTRGMK